MPLLMSLQFGNNLTTKEINTNEKVTFGSGAKDTVQIGEMPQSQITVSYNAGSISLKLGGSLPIIRDNIPLGRPLSVQAGNGENAVVFFHNVNATGRKSIKLPYDGHLSVGRSDKNDIIIGLPFVSGKHFNITCSGGNVRVDDADSTNGLYLNGRRIKNAVMRNEDVLNILTVKISLVNGVLYFENTDNAIALGTSASQSQRSQQSQPQAQQTKTIKYRRSPRTRARLPYEDIILAAPPSPGQEYNGGDGLLDAVNIATSLGSSAIMGMYSPAMAAFRTISTGINLYSSKKRKKELKERIETYQRERKEKYTAYIADQQAKIEKVMESQRTIITEENPTPQNCLQIVGQMQRNLWERMPSDDDFLNIRVGMGYDQLCVDIKSRAEVRGFKMETDEMEELCAQIAEENRIVDYVPARVNLRNLSTVGILGDRNKVVHFVRNMLINLSALHSAEEVHVVGIFSKEERSAWSSLRWLPHIWDENHQFRFLAFDEERAHNICELMKEMLVRRQEAATQNNGMDRKPGVLPHYVFILGDKAMTEREAIMDYLSTNHPELGITALFLYDDIYYLPQHCQYIIDLNNNPCAYNRMSANEKFFFTPDEPVSGSDFDKFARKMAAVEVEDFRVSNTLPNSVTFMEGYGVRTVEQLDILRRWSQNDAANSLAAPIGVMPGGKPFMLDIHSKAHGAHGLIAGTTGSGKSELIQSWILSMAINYHPYDVNFVIIDYKGGSMAQLLEPLPHVVNKLTNIDANIGRSLVSIEAEIKRRERLMSENRVNTVGEYQRLFKSGMVKEPMPHLIIVSDEFAELKKEEPEFMDALTSFARVGRSLGIHIVLATQKPTGVVNDQIDSNSRFRICMKVNDVSDSREIIKKPDAATITQPGRAYVRVGNDEIYALVQSYWSGAEYMGDKQVSEHSENKVRVVDINGRRLDLKKKNKKTDKGKDELTVIIEHINQVAESRGIKKLPGLWMPELPEEVHLSELPVTGVFGNFGWSPMDDTISVPVGLFDRPQEQKQGVQYLDFSKDTHFAIYGGGATGKTTLLKTMMMSMVLNYSPSDVNIYAIDCGGRTMGSFEGLPHVGGVVLDYEAEKWEKLQEMLLKELQYRKFRFQDCNVGNIATYRRNVAKDMADIFIVIDNLVPAMATFNGLEALLVILAGEGSTYGIHVIFTSHQTTGINYKITNGISGIITFQQNDISNYQTLLSSRPATMPQNPGRALIKNVPPQSPIEFQIALYAMAGDDTSGSSMIDALKEKMEPFSQGIKAKAIPVLPKEVKTGDMVSQYKNRDQVPVGIRFDTCELAYIDLSQRFTACITGRNVYETEDMLKSVLDILISRSDNEIHIFDTKTRVLGEYADKVACYSADYDGQALKDNVNSIIDAMEWREEERDRIFEAEGNFNKARFLAENKQICIILNDVVTFADSVDDNVRDALECMCRLSKDLGLMAIATAGEEGLISNSTGEPLARTLVASQNALIVTGKAEKYSCFKNNLSYEEKKADLEENEALFIENGRAVKVRPMK